MEKVVGNYYQCGFRKGKSTIDNILAMRQIMEKILEYGISTYQLYIDFKAAYDTIRRNKLLEALVELNRSNFEACEL